MSPTADIRQEIEEGIRQFFQKAHQEVQRDRPYDIQTVDLPEAQSWFYRQDSEFRG
jgi:hypothetical protein